MISSLYIAEDKRWIVDKLKKTLNNQDGFFESNKDVFIFAAAIGFNHSKPRKLADTKGGEIPLHIFTKENKDYIDTLAIASTMDTNDIDKGDVDLLSWENETAVDTKLNILQEYANGGLELLDNELFQNRTTVYDNLLQLIHRESYNENNKIVKIGYLSGMIDEI